MKRVRQADQIQLESPMRCPRCSSAVKCMDSRGGPNNTIRRRRMCISTHCAHRFTTYEIEMNMSPIVSIEALAVEVRKRLQTAIELLRPLGEFADVIEQLGKLPRE